MRRGGPRTRRLGFQGGKATWYPSGHVVIKGPPEGQTGWSISWVMNVLKLRDEGAGAVGLQTQGLRVSPALAGRFFTTSTTWEPMRTGG